ncbi:MAG: hypothetical protein KAT28_03805 [Candidatus Aenigmarchaeota archaeon]|nr:hypothetical protein [Candidatus Aenigmarchaeota archaeon]
MHSNKLSRETISLIKDKVKNGESRYKIAEELKLDPKTIYNHTEDMPKSRQGRKISEEDRKEARELVKLGMSKANVSKTLNMSYLTAMSITADIKSTNDIKSRFLMELINKGFIMPKTATETISYFRTFRSLKDKIPVIKLRMKEKRCLRIIYFLEEKKEEAFRGYLDLISQKMMDFKLMAKIGSAFGVKLSVQDKVGKKRKVKISKSEKSEGENREVNGGQSSILDFIGKFLHCRLLVCSFFTKNIIRARRDFRFPITK